MYKFFISLVFIVLFQFPFIIRPQANKCNLKLNPDLNLSIVNTNDIKCISKNNLYEKTLLYSFGIWCKPCILHLRNAYKLSTLYKVNLYVLLIDTNNSDDMKKGVEFLRKHYPEIKILALDDEYYSNKRNKKYRLFLKEITPKKFKNINDMSKYILIDNNAKVLMVTNWKDNKENDWKSDHIMLQNKIVPFLSKKNE